MAGPLNQNLKGRRLTPVLLKQGLVLLPLSLKKHLAKRLASKYRFKGESVAGARLSNPRR
jgi:hypothetical protein